MKTTNGRLSVQKSIMHVVLATAGILLIPFIGMRVSNGWNWSVSDFLIAGLLVMAIGSLIELARHTVRNTTHRAILMSAIVIIGLWIWAELAVGIFTTWGS